MSSSSYYYRKSNGSKGAKPTKHTYHRTKGFVCEKDVIDSIKDILSHEFIDCGYHVMTAYLKRKGYKINHKKVYRIMKNAGLLKASSRITRGKGARKFVQFRKVETSRPLECIEMDIKLVWLPNVGKNAYLLSIIDLHTRKILAYRFARQMKQNAVIDLLGSIFDKYGSIDGMVIRSDNGSQFLATDVRNYIEMMGVSQEFTHVATPEENAHIEAYHGTLKRDIFDRIEYQNFGEIEQILKRYVYFYNNERLHRRLGRITPQEMWNKTSGLITSKVMKSA